MQNTKEFHLRFNNPKSNIVLSSGFTSFVLFRFPFEITMPSVATDNYTKAEHFHIAGDKNLYELTFSNKGGLVMPIII